MVVSKQQIQDGLTEQVLQTFTEIIERLSVIPNRENRLVEFARQRERLDDDSRHVVDLIVAKETEHIDLMKEAWPACFERERGSREGIRDRKHHDWSKDPMYMFVTACKFDCQVKHDAMDKLFDMEVKRHYQLEPHHPQYEEENRIDCTDTDILEMAVDRLSRAAQSSGGKVDIDNMKQFLPIFFLGGVEMVELKSRTYWRFVLKYKDVVINEYEKMFG